jgi:Fur family ferric uptake transcriptional regulator
MPPRNTKQKTAIYELINSAEHPLTAQEIELKANAVVPGIGIATVYRALKRLQQEELVTVVELPGKSPRYESTQKGHHHHFVCRKCGKVFDLEGCSGNVDALAPKGFQVEAHEITLFGQCDLCSR